jgi:hypothetical protein
MFKKAKEKKEKTLPEALEEANTHLKRLASFRFRFLFGIIEGFGAVIGATIVVSIAVIILSQLATIDFLEPVINEIFKLSGVQK